MRSWRDELAARVAAKNAGEVVIASLLVAAHENLVRDAAAACSVLPPIDGVKCHEVAPGVVRVSVDQTKAATDALGQLRSRLDAKSVPSAVEWVAKTAVKAAPVGSAVAQQQPAQATTPATQIVESRNDSDADEHTDESDRNPPEDPAPPNPLAAVAITAVRSGIDFLSEGWTAHKVIAKGTVDFWRKPVDGAAIDAVKMRGTVVPLGIGIAGVARLMKDESVKRELSKSTPSPIGVLAHLDSFACVLDGKELTVDLFYQENKFPWPLSNRHACYVACHRRLQDGRYIFIESTVEHEECRRRAGSSGVVWSFVNTIVLEESGNGDDLTITLASSFDIGGDIPTSTMNLMIEDMGGLYKDWNKLLADRPSMVTEVLEQMESESQQQQDREDEERAASPSGTVVDGAVAQQQPAQATTPATQIVESRNDSDADEHTDESERNPPEDPAPPNPLAAVAITAVRSGIDFLSEGWTAHKVIAKGTVDFWRKPVDGAAIDAVKMRGTVVPLGIGIAGVARLMKDESVKRELSKSTPSPIGVLAHLDSFACVLDGKELTVDLFYQENKFPWPLSNRHACYVACHRRLQDGRYIFIESTVEHEECKRRAGSSGVVWSFVNTIVLEESGNGDDLTITLASSFDIGGDIPTSTMNLMIEDMGGLYKDWNKLLADRPSMVTEVLEQMESESQQQQDREDEERAASPSGTVVDGAVAQQQPAQATTPATQIVESRNDSDADEHTDESERNPPEDPAPPNPLAAVAITAVRSGIDFLSEGWTAHKVIAKGTVDFWRKPVDGAAIDAVKMRGTVVPLGIGIAGVARLMKDESVKRELSKSTPSPIGVLAHLDSFACVLDGKELTVDLFYQENKFPWPLSNRHACYVACHRRLQDGRYIFIESTVEHEECRRRAGSSGVVWSFVNTIVLEESGNGDDLTITLASSFDIGGDIPTSTMNLMIEDMGGLYKDWNKLLADRPSMVTEVLEQMESESQQQQDREDEERAASPSGTVVDGAVAQQQPAQATTPATQIVESRNDSDADEHTDESERNPPEDPAPPNPLAAVAITAVRSGIDFLSEGWTAHKVIAKGTVDFWRKPVDGAAIDAVKMRGTVVPLGIGIAGVARLMKDESVKRELSKSTPSPIGVLAHLDSFACVLDGKELTVDLFYQENKFPWPLSNRHACYVACHRRLQDGRYIFIESTVEHEECRRRAGSSGVVWSFVNTIVLEESGNGDDLTITLASSFDIGGDIPTSTMNLMIEDMGGLYKDWNKLLADRPSMVTEVLEQMESESQQQQDREDEERAASPSGTVVDGAASLLGVEVHQQSPDVHKHVPGELGSWGVFPAMDVILPSVQQFTDGPSFVSTSRSVACPDLRPITDLSDQLSVVILGDCGAGTTSLIARARTGSFKNRTKKTVGADGATHSVRIPGYNCKLRVWDCASISEESSSIELKQIVTRLILRAHIVMVVYVEPTQATCRTIKLVTETLKSKQSSALVVGVMTQADKKRKRKPPSREHVDAEVIQTMSCLQHFVTSAKTGYGVAHLFETVVGQAVISRSWQPGRVAADQRRAWAQVCAHRQVPMRIAAEVARRLHGGCTPWHVVGQASIDRAITESSIGRWKHALFNLTVANAVFKGNPDLSGLTWRALLHCVQIDIPRAELVTDSATGTEHTTYVLRCRAATGDGSWVEQFVSRRYSEFVSLHAAIQLRAPGCASLLEPLPAKRLFHSEALVEERRQMLGRLVGNLLATPAIVETGLVQQFCVLKELLSSLLK